MEHIRGDRLRVGWPQGEVSRGEKMTLQISDPESYTTEWISVNENKEAVVREIWVVEWGGSTGGWRGAWVTASLRNPKQSCEKLRW